MASFQARQRDPLLDQGTQEMLERRGRELLGAVLLLAGIAFTLMLMTYSPEDPGWMVATDEPAQNLLGRGGAAVASTLMIIIGKGAWAIPTILLAWGARFVLHRGGERAVARVIFAVIAVALASIYAAALVPGTGWGHSFGLGGLFGDTILGALVGVIPGSAGFGLTLMAMASFLGLVAMLLFVTGFDMAELGALSRFLLLGGVRTYHLALTLAGQGAGRAARLAAGINERRRAAAAASVTPNEALRHGEWRAAEAPLPGGRRMPPLVRGLQDFTPEPLRASQSWNAPATLRAEPRAFPMAMDLPKEKLGFLARMRRAVDPEPELVEPAQNWAEKTLGLPDAERIRARITDVVRARVHPDAALRGLSVVSAAVAARREPVVQRSRGPQPLMADTRPQPFVTARPAPDKPFAEASPGSADAMDDNEDDTTSILTDRFTTPDFANPDRRPAVVQASAKKPAAPSRQALAESQPRLRFDEAETAYELPPLSLLCTPVKTQRSQLSTDALEENARMLESVLDDYGVKGEITSVRPGPVVTMYELEPAPGLKASRVVGLADDIARSMSALSARVSTVPGRTVIGIELPNATREKVVLREIIATRDFGDSTMRLPLALGKDIGGEPVVANLAKMPHLLIAGTTGSGKSVAINTMILSLLYKLTPEECRLIMIDPKMLELSVYDGIPHLLSPVVTDPKKAVVALKWVVGEMEERYRKMSRMGVRNIEGYNGRVREALARGEMFKRTIQTGFDDDTGEPVFETDEFQPVTIPYIVVVVDEMADLMMVAGKEIEACIQRLAQMARASGIHLIMATQRPSVDVITGTIKANFPTRISFQVTSKIDSRTILGEQGAEQLLGMGDMLYMGNGARITRIHGPFVSDEEVEEIVNHLKSYGPPVYMSGVVESVDDERDNEIDAVLGLNSEGDDTLYDQAVAIVAKDRKCSTSYIQRKLGIGYNKAAKLVEQMEEQGVVTRANHVGKREILVEER